MGDVEGADLDIRIDLEAERCGEALASDDATLARRFVACVQQRPDEPAGLPPACRLVRP